MVYVKLIECGYSDPEILYSEFNETTNIDLTELGLIIVSKDDL